MQVIASDNYERLGAEFQYQWILLLKATLAKHGVPPEQSKEICGDFTFDLSMLLDQGEIDYEGSNFRPVVAFASGPDPLLVQSGDFEYHDYAFGSTDEAFASE